MKRLLLLLALLFALPVYAQTPSAPARSSLIAPRVAPAAPAAMAPASSTALVDVNSASATALDTLPGVGASRAQGIIANRPYLTKQDLLTKKVLPANVYQQVEPRIALVNVNTTSAADMAKILTGIGPVRAAAIVKARPFATPQDLVTKGVLTQSIFNGIKELVTAS
jgi:competence protein ComEA